MIDCPFARPPNVLRPLLSLALGWAIGCASPPPAPEDVARESPPRPANLQLVPSETPVPLFDWTERVDFDGFRHWFGRREDFAQRCEGAPSREAAGHALLRGDHGEAERLTALLVAACPVDPSFHLWRFAALAALDRTSEADLHRTWYLGLIESILTTGDGRSAETPIVTISNAETWAVLSHLGLTAERHRTEAGPPALDIVEVRSEDGAQTRLYFHPAFRALRASVRAAR